MVWRACERFNIRPPNIVESWDDNSAIGQAYLVAYDEIRQHEENQSGCPMVGKS
jgi:hypothetical protein